MFELSGSKPRSKIGKLSDKLRGKKKEGLSDSASAILPSVTQVMTDSEGEAQEEEQEDEEEAGAGEKKKKKKNKLKSLFVPKSSLQKTSSQSMSSLGPTPEKDTSGLSAESPEGKKKFKLFTHKRPDSSDTKASRLTTPPQLCVNDRALDTEPQHAASTEREQAEEEEEERRRKLSEEEEEQERRKVEEERQRKFDEERKRKEREEEERKKMEEEEERKRKIEEERKRKEREEEEERKRKIEEEKKRKEREEEERKKMEEEEERKRKIEEERKRKEREEEEERKRKIEEEKKRKEREEEERKKMEEEEERKRKIEEERKRKEREEEEERKRKIEEERKRKEREEEEDRKRKIEEERKRKEREEEEERKRKIEEERKRKEREEEEDRKRKIEEERKRKEREEEEERKRKREEEEERKRKMEERKREEEEEKKRKMEEEERKIEEERKRKEREEEEEEEERKWQIEEERKRKEREEEERKRKIEEEERKRKIEEERKQKEREEEEEWRKMDEERQRKTEEERKRKEREEEEEKERKRKIDEERKRKERAEEEERKRKEREEEEERIRIEREKEEQRIKIEEVRQRKLREAEERKRKEKDEEEGMRREKEKEEQRKKMEEEKERKRAAEKKVAEEQRREEEKRERKRREEEEERLRMEREKEKERLMKEEEEHKQRKNERGMKEGGQEQKPVPKARSSRVEPVEPGEPFSLNPFEEHNAVPSARVTAVKPSISLPFVVNTNPFLDDDDDSVDGSLDNFGNIERTSKKGRAPLPPQNRPETTRTTVSPRGFTLEETKQYSQTKEVSKRPAPLPPGSLKKTTEEPGKDHQSSVALGQGVRKTLTALEKPQTKVVSVSKEELRAGYIQSKKEKHVQGPIPKNMDPNNKQANPKHADTQMGQNLSKKQVDTNPFTCGTLVAKHNKGPAPAKPTISFTSSQKSLSDSSGSSLEGDTTDLKEQAHHSLNQDCQDKLSDLTAAEEPKSVVADDTKPELDEESRKFTAAEPLQNDHINDHPKGEVTGEDLNKLNVPESLSLRDQESLVCKQDGYPDLDNLAPESDPETEISKKKSQAPLPPAKPRRAADPDSPNQQISLSATLNLGHLPVSRSDRNDQEKTQDTATVTDTSSPFPPLAETPDVKKSNIFVSAGPAPGSGSRALPCARVMPTDAQSSTGEIKVAGSAPASIIRQHAVKPLNTNQQQPDSSQTPGVSDTMRPGAESTEEGGKGPYSLLTRSELISLLMQQQEQLSKRDNRISELEEYIDKLLLRILEEQPSILLSNSSQKKMV
ncbi:caldesmon isoform X2 [Hoplias malabaricus]